MKALFLTVLALFMSSQALAWKTCDIQDSVRVTSDNSVAEIVEVHGNIARQLWVGMSEKIRSAPENESLGYNVMAKLSDTKNCWRYFPAETDSKGNDLGPANCEAFTCTVITWKKK